MIDKSKQKKRRNPNIFKHKNKPFESGKVHDRLEAMKQKLLAEEKKQAVKS